MGAGDLIHPTDDDGPRSCRGSHLPPWVFLHSLFICYVGAWPTHFGLTLQFLPLRLASGVAFTLRSTAASICCFPLCSATLCLLDGSSDRRTLCLLFVSAPCRLCRPHTLRQGIRVHTFGLTLPCPCYLVSHFALYPRCSHIYILLLWFPTPSRMPDVELTMCFIFCCRDHRQATLCWCTTMPSEGDQRCAT